MRNTDRRDWRQRFARAWERFPELRCTRKALHERARRLAASAAPQSLEEFSRKLSGARAASDAFVRALYLASELDARGLSFEAWTAEDAIYTEALRHLPDHTWIDRLRQWCRERPCDVTLAPRVTQDPVLRRFGTSSKVPRFAIGSRLTLSIAGRWDSPVDHLYGLFLEWGQSPASPWQALNALPGLGLPLANAWRSQTIEGRTTCRPSATLTLTEPAGHFELFAIVQPEPFDHRIVALIDGAASTEGSLSEKATARLAEWVRDRPGRLFGTIAYVVY